MKTVHAILFSLCLATVMIGVDVAFAQQTPEFLLHVQYRDTSTHAEPFVRERAFGYDPTATDAYDVQFGENGGPTAYPGSIGSFPDMLFLYPNSDSATIIDIRKKPASQSFSIDYTMGLKFQFAAGALHWDPRSIPEAINAIWIRPYFQRDTVLVDMTRDSVFKVSLQQNSLWSYEYLITLFYNMAPPPLAVGDHRESLALLSHLAAYPNPIRDHGKLSMVLGATSTVTVTGYDETGCERLRQIETLPSGSATIALTNVESLHGSILLHVEATSASRTESRNILLIKD